MKALVIYSFVNTFCEQLRIINQLLNEYKCADNRRENIKE